MEPLSPEYQELFATGQFPKSGGRLFLTNINTLKDTFVAVLGGGPMVLLGLLPFGVAFTDALSPAKAPLSHARGPEMSGALKVAVLIVPLTTMALLCVATCYLGFKLIQKVFNNQRELAQRAQGLYHFGVWLDDRYLAIRSQDGVGRVWSQQIPRSCVTGAVAARYQMRHGSIACVRISFVREGKTDSVDLTESSFGLRVRQELVAYVGEWAKESGLSAA